MNPVTTRRIIVGVSVVVIIIPPVGIAIYHYGPILFKNAEAVRNLAWAASVTIAVLMGTPLLIIRTIATNRSSQAAARQADTAVKTHITESFTHAIEQLGHDKTDVRLGAIYALERIAQNNRTERWPIMETLTAYVRQRRPAISRSIQETEHVIEHLIEDVHGKPFTSKKRNTNSESETELDVDVQSALTVIGRRKKEHDPPGSIICIG